MGEIVAAIVTTLDILIIYMLLQVRRKRLVLILWTAFLNMLIPLIGFYLGEISTTIFANWSTILSSVLLSLIGLHMLLHEPDTPQKMFQIPPPILAFVVSIDAFSVSVTLGMLQLNKVIFILASGVFSFLFAAVALYLRWKMSVGRGKWMRRLSGISLIIIGILSFIR